MEADTSVSTVGVLISWIPMILLIGVWLYMTKKYVKVSYQSRDSQEKQAAQLTRIADSLDEIKNHLKKN